MKVKIFKCIMNGENAVECSLHGTMKAAVVAANQFIETFGEAWLKWYDTSKELEASIGKIQGYWDNEDWGVFFALYIGRIQNSGILGVNTVTIEAETIEAPEPKILPMYGFTGEWIGAIDVNPEVLSKKALAVIRNFAWKCTDEGDEGFNIYNCDECFWENVPENYKMSKKTKTEIDRFLAFMKANNVWWARFIEL